MYIITRNDGEQYVGVTKYPERRMKEHFSGAGSKSLKNQQFTHLILRTGDELEIYKAEQEYIKINKPTLNKAAGGWGGNTGSRFGDRANHRKLGSDNVLDIRNRVAGGETRQSLADYYGVTRQTITDICTGKSWNSVGGPLTKAYKLKQMTDLDKLEIRRLRHEEKLTYQAIADMLEISIGTAYRHGK